MFKVFYTLIELSIGIKAGALARVYVTKNNPRPLSYGCSYGKGHAELWFKCL